MPAPTQAEKTERRIERRCRKAISDYQLIEDGDKVLIGLSGGKDSLCLLEMLGKRMMIHKPSFTATAVHIRMENVSYETDCEYIRQFAAKWNIPLYIETTRFEFDSSNKKTPCFLCSWNRRKQLFTKAQELGCNKIALGHHMDDIIHTTMMNMFFQGHFSTMPAKLRMKKMPITIIRPLCMVEERDILSHAENMKYRQQVIKCPFEKDSHRSDMAEIFRRIENMNPEARYSMMNALEAEGKLIEI